METIYNLDRKFVELSEESYLCCQQIQQLYEQANKETNPEDQERIFAQCDEINRHFMEVESQKREVLLNRNFLRAEPLYKDSPLDRGSLFEMFRMMNNVEEFTYNPTNNTNFVKLIEFGEAAYNEGRASK